VLCLIKSQLTLMMTSAHVVEKPVNNATTNSPSQDNTHPDDHNLPTCDMNPGFKPFTVFTFLWTERLANDYISYTSNVRRIRQQLWLNHRCKNLGLVPAGLRLNSPLNTRGHTHTDRQSHLPTTGPSPD